jgi:hypothetical protein
MQETWYDVFESSWGWIGVIGSAKGIRYCSLPEETPDRAVEYVSELVKGKLPEQRSGVFDQFEREIEEYFAGDRQRCDVARSRRARRARISGWRRRRGIRPPRVAQAKPWRAIACPSSFPATACWAAMAGCTGSPGQDCR